MVLDSARLIQTKTSAPALSRGLAVLATLDVQSPRSLESISSSLSLPKASTLRLLETLEKVGMVQKRADKRYEPLWSLQPIGDARASFRQMLQQKMSSLCQHLLCTLEWYEPDDEGMRLVLQYNPQTEVHVKARPGFLRDWATEFEAVARLGAAFAPQAPEIRASSAFIRNGQLRALTRQEIASQLTAARESRQASDKAYNKQGVRRHAVAAFNEEGGFLGVLAIAEVVSFGPRRQIASLLKELHKTLP